MDDRNRKGNMVCKTKSSRKPIFLAYTAHYVNFYQLELKWRILTSKWCSVKQITKLSNARKYILIAVVNMIQSHSHTRQCSGLSKSQTAASWMLWTRSSHDLGGLALLPFLIHVLLSLMLKILSDQMNKSCLAPGAHAFWVLFIHPA